MKKIIIQFVLLLLLLGTETAFSNTQSLTNTHNKQLTIGVLAFRAKDITEKRWQSLAEQLSTEISGYHFRIIPLNYSELEQAVIEETIDFVLTNTAHHIFLQSLFQTVPLATLENWIDQKAVRQFGGVIFTLAKNNEINSLQDLKNKTFAAVKKGSLGGYLAAKGELMSAGINTESFFSKLTFSGMPHDQVVLMVANGEVEAGTVRAGVLESMAKSGKINLNDFKILNVKTSSEYFPYLHSTGLYPEWPFSKLHNVELEIAKQVSLALLKQPLTVTTTGHYYKWNIPLDYKPINQLLKTLKIRPFDHETEFNVDDIYFKYQYFINVLVLFILSVALFYGINLHRLNGLLKQANIKIKISSEAKYKKLIENLQVGYFFYSHNVNGVFLYVSPSVFDTLGYQPDEFLTHWETFLTNNPINKDAVIKTDQTLKGESTPAYYLEVFHKQGHKCTLEVSETAVFDDSGKVIAVEGIAHDVTERKGLEDELEKEKQFLTAVLDSISDTIIVCDKNGVLQLFNQAGVVLHGEKHQPLLPLDWSDHYNLYEADGKSKLKLENIPLYKAFTQGSVSEQELMIKPKNSPAVSVIASGRAVIDKKGNKLGAVVSVHDITERKKNLKQLQKSLKEKEILLREVHHRVKNNMQVISSLLSLQIRKSSDEVVKQALAEAQHRVKAMASVHELLYRSNDLAQIEAKKLINNICTDLFRLYQEQATRITLNIEVDEITLDLDKAVPFGLILNELLSNALKYAFPDQNKGIITIQLTADNDQYFQFVLSDNGVGIPSEYTNESSNSLGMKLIMALSDQLNAEAKFDDKQEGTCFILTCRCVQS